MSIDAAIAIAWDVFKSVVVPIKRQFGYVIYSKRHAQELQTEVDELAFEVDRVHNLVEPARNNLRNVYSRVTEWHASAEKVLKEARDLLRDFQEASKTCCYETLPDPKCRYQFSRKAKDKIEVIQGLTQKCSGFKELNDISFRNPAPGNVAALTPAKREGISSSNPAPGNIAALTPAEREGISSSNPAPGNVAALTPAKREGISSSNPAPGNVAALTPAKREGKDVVQLATVTASASFASTSNKVRDNDVFKSRASIIRDIMAALADNNHSVVGIYGMGGVGKSTLLGELERRISKEKSFDWVAKADVSENEDIKRIQGEIADRLGLTEIKNKETISGRAGLLHERLENEEKAKKKVLIILDNLWKGLNLKSVGIPCGHDNKVIGCKLLLTSRFQDVLRREMVCDRDFHLDELKEEEAKRLFERTVGEKVHEDPFKSLVDEALHKCAGLPFLIIAMANIFRDAAFPEWKDVLRQIEMSTNKGMSERINEMLQLTYNRFKGEDGKEVKSLLRLCVLYGVSKPSLENLVRYGVGSKLFREDSSMEEVRDRMSSLVQTLKASSLLLKDDEDVDGFKIHDLVRGFVASVASRDDPLLVLKDNNKSVTELPKDKLKSCTAVCFPYVNMKELPGELDCPEMQILLLFANDESLKVPDSYFNSMRKLMVLHLSQIRLTHSPSSFQFLDNLHTLCLDGCSLEDVAMIGELKGLHILSFVDSKILRLPKEIGQLVELRLLDLNNCSQLRIIEPGVLGSLIKLEELYMENSFDQWNVVEQTPPTNAKLIELNNQKNLCTLHMSIPDPRVLPEDLNIEKLTKYEILIGNVRRWRSHKGLSTLELKLDPTSNILRKGCIQTLLGKTDDLFLDGFNGIEQSVCSLSQEGFEKLNHLQVENSSSVHYVFQSPSHTDFKKLESLRLKNLINLEKICNNYISSKSFSALKVLRVNSCNKMEILFPLSLLRELPQLKEIRAVKCHLMREIVKVDDCGKIELRNLHVLKLSDLPNIKNFFTIGTTPSCGTSNDQVGTQVAFFSGQQVLIPSLESLTMVGLPNLEDLWTDESPLELSNLQFLKLSSCNSLSKVINSRSLIKLHKLHTLEVEDCISMQEIFDLDGLGAGANIETLSELNTIHINQLPSLRCIWNKNPCGIVRFHNLKKLKVSHCNNLRFLFFPSMVQSLAQLRELYVWYCKNMEVIIMEEEELRIETSKTLVFPMLTMLDLTELQSLTCFSHRKCTPKSRDEDCVKSCSIVFFNQEVAFPSLETLEIWDMNNIEIIWDNQVAADSFHKLKSLKVWGCDKLLNIVPSCILGRLRSLESLEVESCNLLEVVFKLQPLNPLDGHPVAHLPLKRLELGGLPKLKCIWDKELHSQVKFQCLCLVTVSGCESLTSLFPASIAIHLIQLEELEIDECGIVELIEKEDGQVPRFAFPKLTSLKLKHLVELKCIYIGKHASHWPALKTLEVLDCDKVEILASQPENEMSLDKQPLFMIEKGAFPNLQEIKLDLSGRMEIWHGHFDDGEFFSKLRVLELHHFSMELAISTCFFQSLANLEKLVVCKSYREELNISIEAIAGPSHELEVILPFSFQHLKTLEVSYCDGLSPYEILPFPKKFQHLETLDMSFCDWLSNIFTPTIARNLVELTKLRISKCKMLTEVICDEEGEEGLMVAFNQLKYIELDGLTRLRCFSSIKYTLMFPLLEDVIVSGCATMKLFSWGPIEAPKLDRVQISTETWFWKENLNITIQNMFEEMEMVATLKFMRLSEFPELIGKWHSELNPIKLSWQLKSLMVDRCPSFVNAISSKLMLLLVNMKRLQVCDCKSLEEIFDLKGLVGLGSTRMLPSSMTLDLVNLPKLGRLWNKDLQGLLPYNFLYYITLYNCSNLRHVFNPSMAQCLANLRQVEIKECNWMEGVIKEEEGQRSTLEKITFPNLESMKLECLPNLTSFLSRKNQILECPNLIKLTIVHCPKMSSLIGQSLLEIDHCSPSLFSPQVQFPQLRSMILSHMDNISKIWTDSPQDTLTFEKLRKVKVENCKSLESLFPHWVATSLTKLEEIWVELCGLEEIVASGDDTSHSTKFLFPQLTSLVFHDMPQLKSFCPNLPTLNWPFLEELRVTHSDKLNMLPFVASMNKWAQQDNQHDLLDPEAHFSFERGIPTLERLLLVDKDIQTIQSGKFFDDFFCKPKALTLACFHDENAVFPPISFLRRFRNLQSLEVFCSSFEDIFLDEGFVDEVKHPALENLKKLKLSKLHNLKCVWREGYLVAKILQSIGIFEVLDCPNLTTLFPAVTSFQNLTKLVVKNSFGLVHLVTISAIINLLHLTDMTIIGCERMKEVMANDENGDGKVISLKKLERLTLQHLPSLECFSSTTSCIFKFPSMYSIELEECPKMKIFCKGTLSTPNLSRATLFKYYWHWNWEGDLNTTIQNLTA